MKYLHLQQMYFKLPDNFKGTVSDAMDLMSEYLEKDQGKKFPSSEIKAVPFEHHVNGWSAFLDVVQQGGKFSGRVAVEDNSYNKIKNILKTGWKNK